LSVSKYILNNLLPKNRQQWIVFVWCLFASSSLWTLLKFSEEREEEVLMEVEFFNPPKDKILVGEKISYFPVKITARGYGFVADHKKVTIDLSKVLIAKKGDIYQYLWIPKRNEEQINKAFDADVKRMAFPIDTIKILFSPRVTKEVFTKFKFKFDDTKEHISYGEAVEVPKKIKVIGAKSILKNIDTIYTDLINLESLESNLDKDYSLTKPFGVDSLLTDTIRVFIGVEKIEKFEFEVAIEVRNKPDSLEVKLFPNEVKISFVCGTNKFSEISPRSFRPYVDFKNVDASFKKLSINLENQPEQVGEVNIEPYSVEYILRTKY
jgi:hypothetical protein